jgi:iron only hydrogenase large subunit-like protein
METFSRIYNKTECSAFNISCINGPGWIHQLYKLKEKGMRFGMWNVRNLYRAVSLRTVAEEISKYKLDTHILE